MRILPPRRLCLALPLLLTGCGLFSGKPTNVNLELSSDAELNPNEQKKSTALHVRIYQLNDDQAFKDANFGKLWDNDPEVLGTTMVGPFKEVVLAAGTASKEVAVELRDGTRFIGVMGLFDEADDRSWQQCVPVAEADDLPFHFKGFEVVRQER